MRLLQRGATVKMMSREIDNPIVGHATLLCDPNGQHSFKVTVRTRTTAGSLAFKICSQVRKINPRATSFEYISNGQPTTFDLYNNTESDEEKLYAFIQGVMTGREGCSNLITINERTPEPLQVARAAFTDR